MDVFPAITCDVRTDGFSKTSFLWRLYRFERHSEGGVDLDLLFLPLSRARRMQPPLTGSCCPTSDIATDGP